MSGNNSLLVAALQALGNGAVDAHALGLKLLVAWPPGDVVHKKQSSPRMLSCSRKSSLTFCKTLIPEVFELPDQRNRV